MKRYLNLLNSFLFGLTGVIWICNGLRDDIVFDFFLGLVWITGAIIWLVRFIKEKDNSQKEN